MRTEDGILVRRGALIWYVNYLNQIHPICFNKKGKSSVKYFALYTNAKSYQESNKSPFNNEIK